MDSPAAALQLQNVLYERKGPIAYVTINRPKVLNALNKQTIAELKEAFEDARDDSTLGGVILTGAGDKAFAAGADIVVMAVKPQGVRAVTEEYIVPDKMAIVVVGDKARIADQIKPYETAPQ